MMFRAEAGKGQERGYAMNEALATIVLRRRDWFETLHNHGSFSLSGCTTLI